MYGIYSSYSINGVLIMNVNEMRFIRLGIKTKFPIKGISWSDPANQHSYAEATKWLQSGCNYGVITGYNGLVVLDIDRVDECKALGLIPADNTLLVRTGSGGLHFYFKTEQARPHKAIFYHPTKKDEDGHPLHLGELQATGQYVVGPGSVHPNGTPYQVINDIEVAEKPYNEVIEAFTKAGCLISTERPKTPNKGAEFKNDAPIGGYSDHAFHLADIWPITGFKQIGDQYCGVHPVHGSTHGYNLVIDPGRDVWRCFRCGSGGGPIQALAVDAGIIECSESVKGILKGEKFKAVAREARKRGLLDRYLK
jgi:hypothetical protein